MRPELVIGQNGNALLVFRALQSGHLQIAAATADNRWSDWRIVYAEETAFGCEPLVDRYRWEAEGVLSVYVQEKPQKPGAASSLRVISFRVSPPADEDDLQ